MVTDHFWFILVNELTSELTYKVIRGVEYHYHKFGNSKYYRPFHDCDWDGCKRIKTIGEFVSYKGDIEVIKWLFTNSRIGYDDKCLFFGCCGDNLDLMKWLYANHRDDLKHDFYSITKHVCYSGRLEIVKWLFDIPYCVGRCFAMYYACEHGQIEIIEWLHKYQNERLPDHDDDYFRVHLNTVKWMIENGHCSTMKALRWAHINKSVDVMELLCRCRITGVAEFMLSLNDDVFKYHPQSDETRSEDEYQ
jgi:hypothetical protein